MRTNLQLKLRSKSMLALILKSATILISKNIVRFIKNRVFQVFHQASNFLKFQKFRQKLMSINKKDYLYEFCKNLIKRQQEEGKKI